MDIGKMDQVISTDSRVLNKWHPGVDKLWVTCGPDCGKCTNGNRECFQWI